ncbi:MAG: DUF3488 domain-containing protein [Phycisphaeraceae bacterium]|nr:DUF3488 domain-containing protein [Phycisphaeraceae bacterium]
MTLQRTLRQALLWTALLAILIYAIAAGSIVVALLGLPAAWGCWWAANQPWAPSVPRLVINGVLLVVLALGLLAASLDGRFNVERIAEMLAMLLVVKLFDRRNARDAAEVLSLAVFLVFGAILTSLKLTVGLLVLVFCPLLVWAALVQQVVAAEDKAQAYRDRIGAPGRRSATGQTVERGLRRMTGGLTLAASMIAVVVFVFIPRGLAPRFLTELTGSESRMVTGFSDTVELGRAGLISESPQKVLDLRVTDAQGGNMGGAGRIYYLRGAVLDRYEDGRWTRRQRQGSGFQSGQTDTAGRLGRTPSGNTVIRQDITLRDKPTRGTLLYAIQEPIAWEFGEQIGVGIDRVRGILRLEEDAKNLGYTVYSRMPGTRMAGEQWAEAMTSEWLADFPSDAVRALTIRLLDDSGLESVRVPRSSTDIAAVARVIKEYLATFTYTLDILRARGDPIEWFLEHQEGHCEYFASAMAAMCRSVGINARVVTGYLAVEYNDTSGQYTVRESNAHAWVEVEHAVGQWRTHDPTPPADLQRVHAPSGSLLATARRWIDAVEFFWVDSVVAFDRGSQRRVLGSQETGEEPPMAALESIADWLQRARSSGWVGLFQAVLAGVIAFVGVFIVVMMAQAYFRRLGIGGGKGPRVRILGGTHDVGEHLLRTLQKAGHPKPAWKPLLAHVSDIPDAGETFSDVVQRLYAARFGDMPLSPDEALGLRRTITQAGQVLSAQSTPLASG